MTGEYQHSIDTKGRLFIPASLREELGETIYVTISIERALCVYSEAAWHEKEEKFNALPSAQARRIRQLFVNAAKCTLDAQGRILLPQKLRNYANLKKDVMVLGVSNHAEIWDKDSWAAASEIEMDPASLEAAVDELNF
jgi:MraZ protein